MKIYTFIKNKYNKKMKILGLTVYQEVLKDGFKVKYYCFGLYKTKMNRFLHKYYLFDIQIYYRKMNRDLYELQRKIDKVYNLNSSILANIRAIKYHPQTFGPYENINQGKDVVLICGGPSAQEFQYIDNAVYVAVNNACSFRPNEIKFDYVFIQELHFDPNKNLQVNEYSNPNCVKFYGTIADEKLKKIYPYIKRIPQSYMKEYNIKRYYLDDRHAYNFAYDLTTECIGDFGGTAFSAMQFILWTNPKRIFLVGADCAPTGNIFSSNFDSDKYGYPRQKKAWVRLKSFVDDVYPDTEIISVNPVGLKGLFTDIYTKNNYYATEEGMKYESLSL